MATPKRMRASHWIAFAKDRGYEIPPGITARRLREAAADAIIPAEMVGNIWHVQADHTDRIAAALGIDTRATNRAA